MIPHESCPGNFIVLEIQPWEIDENNNSVPETTAKRRTTKRGIKIKKMIHSPGHFKTKYSRAINTLQVPEILNAKTSVLWKIYNERRKLKVFSQELERLSHICESRYKR